jgi:hypothetical protein
MFNFGRGQPSEMTAILFANWQLRLALGAAQLLADLPQAILAFQESDTFQPALLFASPFDAMLTAPAGERR